MFSISDQKAEIMRHHCPLPPTNIMNGWIIRKLNILPETLVRQVRPYHMGESFQDYFRIIPEFRNFRLTFHRKSPSKY